ncbi:MAG: hypothetical protein ACP6IP_08905 [Candidatus Njordarchaeia archaeon]
MNASLTLEGLFGSKNKIKILKMFLQYRTVPLSYIRKHINMNYKDLKNYLNSLIDAGLLKEHDIGGVKIYELSENDERVELLLSLFKKVEKEKTANPL